MIQLSYFWHTHSMHGLKAYPMDSGGGGGGALGDQGAPPPLFLNPVCALAFNITNTWIFLDGNVLVRRLVLLN